MKEVRVSIHPTDIRALKYENAMNARPGEQMKVQIKTVNAVKLNPSAPTTALVMVKFEAADEGKHLQFEVDTVTGVTVDPAVDHLDEVIKKNYMGTIMLAVNEKVRAAAVALGVNLTIPRIDFKYQDGDESIDADIFRTM